MTGTGQISLVFHERRYGVFFSDFSHTVGLCLPNDFCIENSTECATHDIMRNILRLLLIFDIVHIPITQYVFLPHSFHRRVLSLLLGSPYFRFLACHGLISITETGGNRLDAINQLLDDHQRFGWGYSDPLDRQQYEALNDYSAGVCFDNTLAGQNASDFLRRRIQECQTSLSQCYGSLLACIDAVSQANNGVFVFEHFLSLLRSINLDKETFTRIIRLAHMAYYLQPNHIRKENTASHSHIIFRSYDPTISLSSVKQPHTTGEPIRYLFSPQYINKLITRWIPHEEWAKYLTSHPSIILEIRRNTNWEDFKRYYHDEHVPSLSRKIREKYVSACSEDGAFPASTVVDQAMTYVDDFSETLSDVSGILKVGALVPLAMKSAKVKNTVDNWNRAAIRRFIVDFRQLIHRSPQALDI